MAKKRLNKKLVVILALTGIPLLVIMAIAVDSRKQILPGSIHSIVLKLFNRDPHDLEKEADALVEKIEKIKKDICLELNNELTALEKVKVINYFIYDIHKFDKSLKKAHTPQLYLLNHVIDTSKGSPVMLGLIYAELARRLNLPIYGVNLPRNFVLCYYDPDYHEDPNNILFYINPSDKGSVLGLKELKHFLRHLKIEEKEFYFTPCSGVDIIERLIINLQFAYERSGQPEKAQALKKLLNKS